MEAVFLIDQEYAGFFRAWSALVRLVGAAGSATAIRVEPLRFSLRGRAGRVWLREGKPSCSAVGWHFAGEARGAYLRSLLEQAGELVARKVRFRVTSEPLSRPQAIELRFEPGRKAYVALPFEDSPAQTRSFFGPHKAALLAGSGVPEKEWDRLLDGFHEHANAHLAEERPYPVAPRRRGALFGKKERGFVWIPRRGTVGRHEILTELHVEHAGDGLRELVDLLSALTGRRETGCLYLQYFAAPDTAPRLRIGEAFLYETTFTYDRLGWAEANEVVERLRADEALAQAVSDTFTLVEQPRARLTQPGWATHQLRRTKEGVYELRVSAGWPAESVDPEDAVAPAEEASGLSWARIA